MKLTLVRHGEMAGDPFICPQRPVDGSLTALGIRQARETGEALKTMKFDYAFSSPYGRALQTAEIALAGRGMDITVLPYMHEWMPNRELENIPSTQAEEISRQSRNAYAEESWKTELGEGYFEMCARIIPPFLKELEKLGIHSRMGGFVPDEHAKDLSLIVFAHGGSLGILSGFLLGVRPFPIGSVAFAHTGAAFFDFRECRGIYYPQLVMKALHQLENESE